MATPVVSNQLITPKDLALEGIWTNPTNSFLDMTSSSSVNTIAQTLATNAWGSSTGYNTRIMTRSDIASTGVGAKDNITGYSTNLCPPFGPLYNYNNNTHYGSYPALSWGSTYLNTSYPNYGYVDVYLRSRYYRMWSWNTSRAEFSLWFICWNNSNSPVGVRNCYVGNGLGNGKDTLRTLTEANSHYKVLDWDGTWLHIMSLPWYDNANLSTSNCYLSIAAIDGYEAFYGMDNEMIYFSTPTLNTALTNASWAGDGKYDIYILDSVKLSYNGQRVSLYIS